jgi:hypothetical protein
MLYHGGGLCASLYLRTSPVGASERIGWSGRRATEESTRRPAYRRAEHPRRPPIRNDLIAQTYRLSPQLGIVGHRALADPQTDPEASERDQQKKPERLCNQIRLTDTCHTSLATLHSPSALPNELALTDRSMPQSSEGTVKRWGRSYEWGMHTAQTAATARRLAIRTYGGGATARRAGTGPPRSLRRPASPGRLRSPDPRAHRRPRK